MTAPQNPLTQLETLIERTIDFLEKELQDPVFMADLNTFLKVGGDFLEAQIGETQGAPVTPVQPVAATATQGPLAGLMSALRGTPAAQQGPPAPPVQDVVYYDPAAPTDRSSNAAALARQQPNVVRH